VKFYRHPMGAPDPSPVPKKDSMNMDYIPVCEDEAGHGPATVKLSLDKVQRLGVRSEEVAERELSRSVRAFASLQFDERKQVVVAPKFGGWIEKLLVNATGDVVTRGQPLFEVYEQDLAFVKVGDLVQVTVNAWPERPIAGKVTFIYPSVGKESRTARLRIEVANPDGLLRADMAATVEIKAPLRRTVVAPDSAIIDSGLRQVVLVERGEGRYEPRPVKLGARA